MYTPLENFQESLRFELPNGKTIWLHCVDIYDGIILYRVSDEESGILLGQVEYNTVTTELMFNFDKQDKL